VTHYLHLTAETEHTDAEYTFECTGVTSSCECWTECVTCSPTDEQADMGEGESHGVFHQHVGGFWAYSSGRCGLLMCDVDLAGDLYSQIFDDPYYRGPKPPRLPSGKYEIEIEDWDEGVVYVALANNERKIEA
jgi:hypothetical protein